MNELVKHTMGLSIFVLSAITVVVVRGYHENNARLVHILPEGAEVITGGRSVKIVGTDQYPCVSGTCLGLILGEGQITVQFVDGSTARWYAERRNDVLRVKNHNGEYVVIRPSEEGEKRTTLGLTYVDY